MEEERYIDESALATLYPAHVETLKERHDRALVRAGASHVIVFSGAPRGVFLDDYHYPFKTNPHFLSWLPLGNTPFCYLVYTPGDQPQLIYYQEKDYWHVAPAAPQGFWPAEFQVHIVHSLTEIDRYLPKNRANCILLGEINDVAHAFEIERVNPATALNMLHFARGKKTEYELECMRAASRRGALGHCAAEAAFKAGKSEFEIHMEYCKAVGHAENDLPYGNIIALNENGAVLHYQHQQLRTPPQIRSFLIDAGARVYGYASDITRTYAKAEGQFAALIERFDALQQELVEEVAVGVEFTDIHLLCHRKIAQLIVEIKLANGSVEALIESGITAAFYPHGLGHLLGIQVHDVGGYMGDDTGTVIDPPSGHPFLRLTRQLEVDQVLTIEPGIYVIDMLLDKLTSAGRAMLNRETLEWLRPFGGIRIEDNVRVLDGGRENLTRDAFAA